MEIFTSTETIVLIYPLLFVNCRTRSKNVYNIVLRFFKRIQGFKEFYSLSSFRSKMLSNSLYLHPPIPGNIYLSINLACLSVCLFVCLYPINVKTAEPIGPKI